MRSLEGKRIIFGVTGSIAAYKSVFLLRTLIEEGAEVSVVMTQSAKQFVTPLTFEVLSKKPVYQDLFGGRDSMPHLTLTEGADLFLIAPATANILAKSALGIADDLLSTMILAARCPMIMAPAMDGEMWDHPAVVKHAQVLRDRGVTILDPEEGLLASGLVGKGRLPTEAAILREVKSSLVRQSDWRGHRVLVSAGPTREPIDPVRFITNGSSGKMGYAIARAAAIRGAEVVLVSGPTSLSPPPQLKTISVVTAQEMLDALRSHFAWATVLIMTAAVGDFRPCRLQANKIKKEEWQGEPLELERTPDILKELSNQKTHQMVVGFAAETEHHLENGKRKLHQKGLDLIAVNHVGGSNSAFGSDSNELTLITRAGEIQHLERMSKFQLAHSLLDAVLSFVASNKEVCHRSPNLRSL